MIFESRKEVVPECASCSSWTLAGASLLGVEYVILRVFFRVCWPIRIILHRLSCEREPRKDVHDPPAEYPLSLVEVYRHVERVAEHVLYLVSVHDSHPFAPHVTAGSLCKVIIVDPGALLCKLLREQVGGADEEVVAHDFCDLLLIYVSVSQVFPVSVLKNNGVSLQACCIFEDEIDDFQILIPFQKTGIILLEIVQEVVEDKVGPFILVTADEDLRVIVISIPD